jgi:hypothetical protein
VDSDTGSDDRSIAEKLDAKSYEILELADKAANEGRLAPAQVLMTMVIAGELIQIRRALQVIADGLRHTPSSVS